MGAGPLFDKSQQIKLSRRKILQSLVAAGAVPVLPGSALAQGDSSLSTLGHTREWGVGFDSASRTIAMPNARFATLTKSTVNSLERAIQEYSEIVRRGGWNEVHMTERLRVGMRHASVVPLRERLLITGDLDQAAGVSDVFDSYVEAAIRRFQARHGITADGSPGESTILAMNVPAEVRLRQLEINIARVRSMFGQLGERYTVVNIPAAHVEAVQNDEAALRHTAVAGMPDRPSPILRARIIEVNFHPFWTVPLSIIRKDLIPLMQKEPDYLAKNGIRIYDQRGNELSPDRIDWQTDEATNYMFRQDPGKLNALGTVRINMPNPEAVYMHDTPTKNLFGEDFRFLSSGCVRVQNIRELVAWLLSETPGWSREKVDAHLRSGERVDAKLAKPVPVHWVYITAWANPDGVVQFRDDVYGHDGLGIRSVASAPI